MFSISVLGLGELCSKIALLCYAGIPEKKLYYAPTRAYYAHIMPTLCP